MAIFPHESYVQKIFPKRGAIKGLKQGEIQEVDGKYQDKKYKSGGKRCGDQKIEPDCEGTNE